MKRAAFIFLLLPAFSFSNAQSHAGITGVRDTSYNMLNEFNKHLKNYPAKLKSGLYFISAFSNNKVFEKKIIVK